MEKIEFKTGGYTIELKQEEVKGMYEENLILMDALLLILNKEVAEQNWDIHMSHSEAVKNVYDILQSKDYNKEFLEKVFKPYNKECGPVPEVSKKSVKIHFNDEEESELFIYGISEEKIDELVKEYNKLYDDEGIHYSFEDFLKEREIRFEKFSFDKYIG